jgi:kumamolisin
VVVVLNYPNAYSVGGTSVGAPVWSGIVALAGASQGTLLGNVNAALYSLAGGHPGNRALYGSYFFDVTFGNNGFYAATPWYDMVTGLGTPWIDQIVGAFQP